jgi:ribonuclease BN (tRNA processing enzyme)
MSEIVFIGTSDAFGAGGRRQSAILMRAPSGSVLLDCGTTTSTGLAALGIERNEIDAIVISHYHGDHFGGIPILLLAALYEDARTRPLRIVGPPGIEARVRQLADAMSCATGSTNESGAFRSASRSSTPAARWTWARYGSRPSRPCTSSRPARTG